jgi:phosphate transport system substrate-binding protein
MPANGLIRRGLLRPTLLSVLLLALAPSRAEEAGTAYEAARSLAGTLRVWGPASMSAITKYWAEGFQRLQPGVKVEFQLLGSDTAIPGLYSGAADIALLGRENNITDDNGFSRPMGYPPVRFELTTGSLDVPGKTPALVVFVHRDNPLNQLTLAQLDAIFGHEHRRGLPNIRTWGELGLTGEWAAQPIRLYGYDLRTGTGLYFLKAVLGNSRKLNWDGLREFKDIRRPDGSVYRAGQQSIDALRRDRYGMAVSCLCFADPEVRDLALAAEAGGPFVRATRDNLVSRRYPLTRTTYAFVDQPPGNGMDPRAREFLRYIYSREGQADIGREGEYLPLKGDVLQAQRRLLE